MMNTSTDLVASPWKQSFLNAGDAHANEMMIMVNRGEAVDYSLEQWYVRDNSVLLPKRVEDPQMQAKIAEHFARQADKQMLNIKREMSHYKEHFALVSAEKARYIDKLQTSLQVYKAERDLWALLEILSRSNLFHIIDEERNQKMLAMTINGLDVRSSIPDVINEVMIADERIRKGAILVEWLESCASDDVQEIPAMDSQNMVTAPALLSSSYNTNASKNNSNNASELYRPRNEDEAYDQEVLLKCVWELVRSGQLKRAQEVAVSHHAYWLASILLGGNDAYFTNTDESGAPMLMGNINKAKWMRSCWKYSQQLCDAPKSFLAEHSFMLSLSYEMSIYAALANNFKVLYESVLVSNTWTNQLWSLIKCSHSRDLMSCLHSFHLRQQQYSPHFLACQPSNLSAMKDLISSMNQMLASEEVMTGSCSVILDQIPPPNQPSAEAMILSCQASVIAGKDLLSEYIFSIKTVITVSVAFTLAVAHTSITILAICALI
jgi:hypothetical protein